MKRDNKRQKKGFTLAELLIVVAIIAVLVAIGIPIFTSQLEKSREATDLSDVRSAYTEVMMAALTQDTSAVYTKDNSNIYLQNGDYQIVVQPLKQKQDGWQMQTPLNIGGVSSDAGNPYWIGVPAANGYCKITYHTQGDYVSFEWSGTADSNGGSNSNGGSDSSGGSDTPGDSKPSGGNGSGNESSNEIGKFQSTPIPEGENENAFSITKGYVYSYKGKNYVALQTNDYNTLWSAKPETDAGEWVYVELKNNAEIKSSADLKPQHEYPNANKLLFGMENGMLYRADDGKIYIYKNRDWKDNVTPPTQSDDNWQEIFQ